MSFYIRKSIKAGSFRYNLSKSGVGVSVGVPGFRVGTAPQGNYIRAGNNRFPKSDSSDQGSRLHRI
jgi:hypothetical protein